MNVTESGRRKRDAGTPSTGLGLCSPSSPDKSAAMRTLLKAQHELLRAGGRSGHGANTGFRCNVLWMDGAMDLKLDPTGAACWLSRSANRVTAGWVEQWQVERTS